MPFGPRTVLFAWRGRAYGPRMGSDLTPYSPRLLLQWDDDAPGASHRAIDGTLVFADVSGFTRLSERLARSGGRAGAEEMGSVVDRLFDELLTAAALRGGEMLKYGGDAALLFFRGEHHAARAAAGAADMQRRLREVGRIETQAGVVRLRMSVGMNSGSFDLFKVGRVHEELIIAGPATTETARMEAAADPGEILVSASTAALLDDRDLGAEKAGGRLLRRAPDAPVLPVVRLEPSPRAGRFVCSRLAQHLDGGVDPDHRLATVAFIHLMDVDGMLLDVGPTLVASRLDATMTVVQEALDDLGVFFLATDMAADGAKVMAAAGAPLAGEDEERRMLLALRRIIDADTPLRVRAGVNRGHVFAASVGPHYRKTFTCIGDVVNTSARVQAKAGPGEVLALAPVLEHARGRFATTVLAPFAAKGKTEPLVPQRVDGFEGDDDAPVSMLPLVGRDVELECLVAAADTARGGSGSLVELVGDMGSGKSRLVEELLLRVPDMRAIVVPCEPYQQATPFHPFTRVLQRLVVGDETGDRAAALRHTVSVRVPHLAPWIPLIAGVLDVAVPDTDATRSLEPRFRMERTAAATGELIKALLPEPTVLVFEDIHWLDDASAVLLSELELVATGSPWVVCVTRRDEPSPFTRSRPESSLVHLTALADDDMHQLVSLATTEAPMPPHRRSAIVQRAGGNPLFLTELLQHGVDSDVLPDSVEAVMAAQIDRLDPAARKLLRRAAVLGSRFDIDMLAALADDASLDRASAASVSRRVNAFLVPDGTRRLRFRHQLIRDVAYQSLPFRERRALHLRAGDAIERAPGHDDCERASILSLHFLHAQEFERCWHHARIAGDRACEKYANVEAVELLERALSAAKVVAGVADEELA
ncbi:MAG: hypothetical protein QOI47_103, partial [Actinomycetota bacterium]|nr:hypothetical protein [Actinomycetota bacterium]